MIEIEILKEFVTKKQIIRDLENPLDDYENNVEKIHREKEYKNICSEVNELEEQLSQITDKTRSEKSKNNVIYQLEQYINEIGSNKSELNLSRSQGIIIENELFEDILVKLTDQMTYQNIGLHIPRDLKFANNKKDSINILELKEFLKNEINLLKNMENINYGILWNYRDDFIERVKEKFIN